MKLPFFQFYPSDYMRDTRALSLAAKGGWVDVLCHLHSSSTRGIWTMPVVGWARVMSASVDQANAIIDELDVMGIADVARSGNGDVTLSSRRMLREQITRNQTRLRVQRHRAKANGNAEDNGSVTGNKSETRNQKPETILAPPPAPRARNELLDSLCRYAELTDPLAASGALWPKLATALKAIKAATPNVAPAEIERRCRNYASHFSDATISATALAKHWGRCDQSKVNGGRDERTKGAALFA